jgi:sigma-E factor negative regulatory protein RseA
MVMRQEISSLMDGELDADRTGGLIERIGRDDEARELWATYHFIGDALRGGVSMQAGIQNRIFVRLTQEPTVLAPKRRRMLSVSARSARVGMAVAASVATISVVTWMGRQESTTPALVAQAPVTQVAVAKSAAEPMVASAMQQANLSEYLLAHEEYSPSTGGYRLANINGAVAAGGTAGR